MAYGVKVGIKAKDIYDRLTLAEKERFEEVNKTEDEVIITAIAIEKHNYDENKYKELVKKESWAMQNIGKISSCPKISL
jgi:hypothetical protein